MKGKSERTVMVINFNYLRPVWDHYFCSPWRLTARHTYVALVQYAFCTGMTGFPWSESLMYLPWQSVLAWDSLTRQLEREYSLSSLRSQVPYRCLQWTENVDYLLIAKPVAINHLGIHCDCCRHFLCWPVVGSSLWRPWFLLLYVTRRTVLEICEIGEQGGFSCSFCHASLSLLLEETERWFWL
jgi:hypothetical protein